MKEGERGGRGRKGRREGEIVTKGEREREELWRINNRPDLSKASLMGCDRNLFTLRLVLNQTRGEWQWQAAAQGCGRGSGGRRAGRAEQTARFYHVAREPCYNPASLPPPPPLGGSSPRPLGRGGGCRQRARKRMYEENKR